MLRTQGDCLSRVNDTLKQRNRIYNFTPKKIRKTLNYLNLLARPRGVLLYLYTFNKTHV